MLPDTILYAMNCMDGSCAAFALDEKAMSTTLTVLTKRSASRPNFKSVADRAEYSKLLRRHRCHCVGSTTAYLFPGICWYVEVVSLEEDSAMGLAHVQDSWACLRAVYCICFAYIASALLCSSQHY